VSGALGELSSFADTLGMHGHLDECDRTEPDWRSCTWCIWALEIPEITTLLDATADATVLRDQTTTDTISWVVAVDQLLRILDQHDLEGILVPSVHRVARGLEQQLTHELQPLRGLLASATSSGGPVEQACLRSAGAIAAAAVQRPDNTAMLHALPDQIRTRLASVSSTLSPDTQITNLIPAIEAHHWRGMPRLRTQPEWSRRAAPDIQSPLRTRQVIQKELATGSLEALVVESVIDQIGAELAEIGNDLNVVTAPVTLRRTATEPLLTSRARSLMWRTARIDWILTFIDTGRASCWNTRCSNGETRIDVPWTVALTIDTTEPLGLHSAIRQGRPLATTESDAWDTRATRPVVPTGSPRHPPTASHRIRHTSRCAY
jgi:hypothetical protein